MGAWAWQGVAGMNEGQGRRERWGERKERGVKGSCVCLFINHLD